VMKIFNNEKSLLEPVEKLLAFILFQSIRY
jgi:hypothetical protein